MEKIKIWFSDFWRPSTLPYIKRNALFKFLSKFYVLVLTKEKPDFLIYSCFGHEYLKYSCIRIFYAGENVRPNFNECDYSFSFDYPITERNYRLPLYRFYPSYDELFKLREPEKVIAQQRKFCCFLASNPGGKDRNEFFKILSSYKSIDAGGKVFFNVDQPVLRGKEIEWMSNYKFCIAFENSSYPGYTTEKILHALVANTIPIYWGNPLIGQDFNLKAFINCHDYRNFADVVEVVKLIDQEKNIYQAMLSEPIIKDGKENEFCKEEMIIIRFDKIFTEKKAFISNNEKISQLLKYPCVKLRQNILTHIEGMRSCRRKN